MALQIRRGTDGQRASTRFAMGEIVWTTDTEKLYVGNGVDNGGVNIAASLAGNGITWNEETQQLDAVVASLNTDLITEGTTNLFFTAERAQDAAQQLFINGNSSNTGIQFVYNDVDNMIIATVNGMVVQNDTNPSLGGNLNLNTHNITGTGNITITGNVSPTGNVVITGNLSSTGTSTLHNTSSYSTASKISTGMTVYSITDGTDTSPGWTETIVAKTNWTSPSNPVANDVIGGYKISVQVSGSNLPVGVLSAELTSTANTSSIAPRSNVYIGVGNNTAITRYKFRPDGVFEAPVVKAANYVTVDLPASPEKGYIAFDSTTNQFKGWNGTSWAVLG